MTKRCVCGSYKVRGIRSGVARRFACLSCEWTDNLLPIGNPFQVMREAVDNAQSAGGAPTGQPGASTAVLDTP